MQAGIMQPPVCPFDLPMSAEMISPHVVPALVAYYEAYASYCKLISDKNREIQPRRRRRVRKAKSSVTYSADESTSLSSLGSSEVDVTGTYLELFQDKYWAALYAHFGRTMSFGILISLPNTIMVDGWSMKRLSRSGPGFALSATGPTVGDTLAAVVRSGSITDVGSVGVHCRSLFNPSPVLINKAPGVDQCLYATDLGAYDSMSVGFCYLKLFKPCDFYSAGLLGPWPTLGSVKAALGGTQACSSIAPDLLVKSFGPGRYHVGALDGMSWEMWQSTESVSVRLGGTVAEVVDTMVEPSDSGVVEPLLIRSYGPIDYVSCATVGLQSSAGKTFRIVLPSYKQFQRACLEVLSGTIHLRGVVYHGPCLLSDIQPGELYEFVLLTNVTFHWYGVFYYNIVDEPELNFAIADRFTMVNMGDDTMISIPKVVRPALGLHQQWVWPRDVLDTALCTDADGSVSIIDIYDNGHVEMSTVDLMCGFGKVLRTRIPNYKHYRRAKLHVHSGMRIFHRGQWVEGLSQIEFVLGEQFCFKTDYDSDKRFEVLYY